MSIVWICDTQHDRIGEDHCEISLRFEHIYSRYRKNCFCSFL